MGQAGKLMRATNRAQIAIQIGKTNEGLGGEKIRTLLKKMLDVTKQVDVSCNGLDIID